MRDYLKKIKIKRNVLVVDDEVINRELLDAILSFNYNVSCASNGREALEMLRSASEPYSLILLDILMPEKSGLQTLAECKADEKLRDIPIIVMTSEKSAEARSIRMGAADFISKPYRMPEVIIARCERVIELTEEKALIHSIETDPLTGFYIKPFFMGYVRRISSYVRRPMNAVAIRLTCEYEGDRVRKQAAQIIRELLLRSDGIACYAEDDVFYVYCPCGGNDEELMRELQEKMAADPITAHAALRSGVCEAAGGENDVEKWFDTALSRC